MCVYIYIYIYTPYILQIRCWDGIESSNLNSFVQLTRLLFSFAGKPRKKPSSLGYETVKSYQPTMWGPQDSVQLVQHYDNSGLWLLHVAM